MDTLDNMLELIKKLNEASISYYKHDKSIMSDKQYDELYDKLVELETTTGIIMANSPTQKVQGEILEGLVKVKHSKLMLSAQKTKNIEEIKEFVNKSESYVSWKLDGLTLVTKYDNGKLQQVLTRGSGDFGEDVTEQAKMITNLPLTIPFKDELELRGECVISWDNFNKINETLVEKFSHPRNLAAGSIRQLDTNIVKERCLEFIVFEVVNPYGGDNKLYQLDSMDKLGFTTVDKICVIGEYTVDYITNNMTGDKSEYPVDGLIFEYTNIDYSKSLGSTSHHDLCRIALKWADDTYETVLRDIEWSTSRTGLINPVAIFDPIDLGGAITTRATLHNISYMEDLKLGVGDTITVYRANMVIPKVDDNLTRSNTFVIPKTCPECGGITEVCNENGSKTLLCTNPNCKSKLLGKLVHFCDKHSMNMDGISESTLEKFVDLGWLTCLSDIYSLENYKDEIVKMDGFGIKSYNNIVDAIKKSKNVKLENFIRSLGIPMIGRSQSKELSKKFNGDWYKFEDAIQDSYDFTNIEGFGETLHNNIHSWYNDFKNSKDMRLVVYMNIIKNEEDVISNGNLLEGLTFVITGSVYKFKNRDEVKDLIESLGGKVAGSVSKSTSYLINNDSESTSSKNIKANELGVKIITEDEFLTTIGR